MSDSSAVETVVVDSPDSSGGSRNTRLAIIGAVVAVAVVTVAGVAVALYINVFSKLGGASSPEAAVEQLIGGIENKDSIAIYGILAPDELYGFGDASAFAELPATWAEDEEAVKAAYETLLDSLSVTFSGVELATHEYGDDLVRVDVIAGDVVVDANVDDMVDATMTIVEEYVPGLPSSDYADMRREMESEFRDTFPMETSIADFAADSHGLGVQIMTVRIDNAWYISPLMTVGEYIAEENDESHRGPVPTSDQWASFETPEAAGEAFVDGVVRTIATGDFGPVSRTVASADQRFLSVYGDSYLDGTEGLGNALQVESVSFSVAEQTNDTAMLSIDEMVAYYRTDTDDIYLEWSDGCIYYEDYRWGESEYVCVEDDPYFLGMGSVEPQLLAVKNGDGWAVSASGTTIRMYMRMVEQTIDMMISGSTYYY